MDRECKVCHVIKPEEEFLLCYSKPSKKNPERKAYRHKRCNACRQKQRTAERLIKRAADPEGFSAQELARRRRYTAYDTNYNATHKAQKNAWRRADHAKNPEKKRSYDTAYHNKNYPNKPSYRTAILEAIKRWEKANPLKVTEKNARRKARIRNAPQIEIIDRAAIIARDRSICHICGLKVAPDDMTLDHLIPVAHGGAHTAQNLAVAHRYCNQSRGAGRLPAQLRLF